MDLYKKLTKHTRDSLIVETQKKETDIITSENFTILTNVDSLTDYKDRFEKKFNRISKNGISAYIEIELDDDTIFNYIQAKNIVDDSLYYRLFFDFRDNKIISVVIKRDKISSFTTKKSTPLVIRVPKGMAGIVIGQHRNNIKDFEKEYKIFLKITE